MYLPLLAFVFGSLLVAGLALIMMPSKAGAIDRRLEELTFAAAMLRNASRGSSR